MKRWTRAVVPVVFAAAMVAPGVASAQESGEDGILPPGPWTEEETATLLDLVDRTEAELPAFADYDAMVAQGYVDFGVTSGGYAHLINQAMIDDEFVLDPSHPESLVYRVNWDEETGELSHELASAMFFLPSHIGLEDIPADLAWYPGWHIHPDICVTPEWTFAGLSSGGSCPAGSRTFDKPPMMHVWITDNGMCDHRFGGIDVGGVHCDVDHEHPEEPEEPEHPHEPEEPEHPHEPEQPEHPHEPEAPEHPEHPANPDDGHDGHGDTPPPAHAVHRHPDTAG